MQPEFQTQPAEQPPLPQAFNAPNKGGHFLVIFLTCIIIILIGAISLIILFLEVHTINTLKIGTIKFTNSYTQLPLNLNNPSILRSYIVYELRGKIQNIKTLPEGIEIVTDIINKGKNLTFTVNDKTIINVYRSATPMPGNIDDLQTGQTVDIVGQYQIREGIWIAKVLLVNEFATASAQIKD